MIIHKSRVKEIASNKPNAATAFNLPDSAATGYRSFDSAYATNDTLPYFATNGTAWESGIGTFTAGSPDTLARTTLYESSTGSAIDWSSGGDVTVFVEASAKIVENLYSNYSSSQQSYFARLAAFLEPLALEPIQVGAFTYAVNSSTLKYLMASWQTFLTTINTGRYENRDAKVPIAIKNQTLIGSSSNGGSSAIFMDPTLPNYDNAVDTYYARKLYIDDSADIKHIDLVKEQSMVFLPGAYGAIITRAVNFDMTWLIGRFGAWGFNLANELGDTGSTDYQRNDSALALPVSKYVINAVESGSERTTGAGAGTISYILCPSTWGKVIDSTSYLFRDDFMGDSLDTTTKWTRAESTAGNVEIDTNFGWLKITGTATWGANAIRSQSGITRATGRVFVCDILPNAIGNTNHPNALIGFGDGAGLSYSNFTAGVLFGRQTATNKLEVYEGGTSRGYVGNSTGYTPGYTYRVRITLTSGGATYEIQGGTQYEKLGGSAWTDITPGTSSNTATPVYPMVSIGASAANCFIGDIRAY